MLTDHPEPELVFLQYTVSESGEGDLSVTKHLSLFEKGAQPAEFCHDVLVDPSGAIAVVSVYTGKLKIIVLSKEEGDDDEQDGCETEFDAPSACSSIARRVTIWLTNPRQNSGAKSSQSRFHLYNGRITHPCYAAR